MLLGRSRRPAFCTYIMAVNGTGDLLLYRGNGRGWASGAQKIGAGWAMYR